MGRLIETSAVKWTKTSVDTFGSGPEEDPRSFDVNHQRLQIFEIIDRWRAGNQRYFRVKGSNKKLYVLRHDRGSGKWEMAPLSPAR